MICAAANDECAGRLEWHHAIKQQRLKREFKHGAFRSDVSDGWVPLTRTYVWLSCDDAAGVKVITLDAILGDPRNRVWLCSHHHELVTNGRLEVTLPQSVWDFAKEFGLTAMLENDLARKRAA